MLFSISGNVEKPGNYELELGTSMRELIYTHGGGIAGGHQLKAVIPGGSSVPALTARQIDMPLDYDSLGAIGTFFGAAALIVVDDRCCMVQLALRVDEVLHARVVRQVHAVPRGDALDGADPRADRGAATAAPADLDLLREGLRPDRGQVRCARSATSRSGRSQSYFDKCRDEFVAHIEQGGCPFGGESSLEGIIAPSDQHTHSPVAEVPA